MEILNATGRAVIAITVIICCGATIAWLIAYGRADNSLHASALSWSYTLIGAILVGLGVGAALPTLIDAIPKKPPA